MDHARTPGPGWLIGVNLLVLYLVWDRPTWPSGSRWRRFRRCPARESGSWSPAWCSTDGACCALADGSRSTAASCPAG
jgi:hypothetical protein